MTRFSRRTRCGAVLGMVATLLGAGVLMSAPVHAAGSSGVVVTSSFTASPTSIEVELGSQFLIDNLANGGKPAIAITNDSGQVTYSGTNCTSAVTLASASCPLNGGSTHPITVVAYGTVRLWNFGPGPTPSAPVLFATITVGPPGSAPSGDEADSSIPDWLQMYGRPATGVCDPNFTPEWAKTPSTPEGGWGSSWAQWRGGPVGEPIGFVCVRTLRYSPQSGSWFVA